MADVFSIDAGKRRTKYAWIEDGKIYVDWFPTQYTELNDFNDEIIEGARSFQVEYNNKQLIFGEQGKDNALDEESKKTNIHKIASLIAVNNMKKRISTDENTEIILIQSMPATSYKSKSLKEQYRQLYSQNNKIIINNKESCFTIIKTHLLPEAQGFRFTYPRLCKKGKKCSIDIGGYNLTITVWNDGKVINRLSLDMGGIELENTAIEALASKFEQHFKSEDILKYLKDGGINQWGKPIDESLKIVEDVKVNYLNDIIKAIQLKQINLSTMDAIYFFGGTASILKDTIKDHDTLSTVSHFIDDLESKENNIQPISIAEGLTEADVITVVGNLLYGVNKYGQGL